VTVDVARVAAVIGDPVRSTMLDALLAGRALAAGELATVARTSRSNASGHLSVLAEAGLVTVVASGRHRYYRLAGPQVAQALEALSLVARPRRVHSLRESAIDETLRAGRTCYDHLAGRLGVAVTGALVEHGAIAEVDEGYEVQDADVFAALGVDLGWAQAQRRRYARQCVDWSERTPHLAGAVGAAVLRRFLEAGWIERLPGSRAVRATPAGRAALDSRLGLPLAA
jgi:DNA-binding transcriptional ArsR family regulator